MYRSKNTPGHHPNHNDLIRSNPNEVKNPSNIISLPLNNNANATVASTTQIKDDFAKVLAGWICLFSSRWCTAVRILPSQILQSLARVFSEAKPEKFSQAGRGSYIKSVSAQLALCLLLGMEDCFSKGNQNSVFNLNEVSLLLFSASAVKPRFHASHANVKKKKKRFLVNRHEPDTLIRISKREAPCACMHLHNRTIITSDPLCELAPVWEITLSPCGMMWL